MTEQGFTPEELHKRKIRSRKLITYLITFAIVMFFAGLTSAYVVSMTNAFWIDFDIPKAFYWSTAFILLSSVFIQLALVAARNDNKKRIAPLLVVVLALGVAFSVSQFKGWAELVEKGNYVTGSFEQIKGEYGTDYRILKGSTVLEKVGSDFFLPEDINRERPLNSDLREQRNTSSSYFYALTGAHLAHLAFGLLSLVVMIIMALMSRYTANDHVGLWAGTIYWHFLGGLWVYLLLFLAFIH
jgi:cytochrome c oxidase subunit 3